MSHPEERELPHSGEAERAVLGAILIDNALLARAMPILGVADFYQGTHRAIYRVLLTLAGQEKALDLLTLSAELKRTGDLDKIGGVPYIAALLDGVPRSTNIEHYSRLVREAAERRELIQATNRLSEAAWNGGDREEIATLLDRVNQTWDIPRRREIPRAANLYETEPCTPRFTVSNFIRRAGLHMCWAEPGAGKTYTLLAWCHELLLDNPPTHLSGHPDLLINDGYKNVLWIGTEEDTATLRWKADKVLAGLGHPRLAGRFLHLWAADPACRITLDDLPAIMEAEGPLDAIVLDSLTGLRPKTVNGERVRWDVDNDAANEICLALRGLAWSHSLAIFIIHHTGRDTAKGYRGPAEWWASADVQVGLVREKDKLKVISEKNRDGKRLDPFYLIPTWGPSQFTLRHDVTAPSPLLSPSAEQVAAFIEKQGEATQAEAVRHTGLARSTVQKALQDCVRAGRVRDTGMTKNRSSIYAACRKDVK